jgi:adenine-specific DNA-methyltransferase
MITRGTDDPAQGTTGTSSASGSPQLDPVRRAELGQFMTPAPVARFMASLFSAWEGAASLLDAGAGGGALISAVAERWGWERLYVSAYEIDPVFAAGLRETLQPGVTGGTRGTVVNDDFVRAAVSQIQSASSPKFTHAILNPPYRKIASVSDHRALLRSIGLETVNLYAAFVGLSIELVANGGEIVAIIPRSFCNGLYYRPFRRWLLERTSIDRIHLFHSRTSTFRDSDVLQENVIVRLTRGNRQGAVTVSTSSDISFSDLQSHIYPFEEIVQAGDEQQYIHVPLTPEQGSIDGVALGSLSLEEVGLEVSTGPVVDFRLKEFLRSEPELDTVPLLYPSHFVGGRLEWPRVSKKPNAVVRNVETAKWLFPSGFYTVVRRFSSKEERRRIVAHVVDPATLSGSALGFENHLNVFHAGKKGIEREIACGLAVYLNSTHVDDYFRRFSGHTQVNATDLRLLRYPPVGVLRDLGAWHVLHPVSDQESIDEQIEMRNV